MLDAICWQVTVIVNSLFLGDQEKRTSSRMWEEQTIKAKGRGRGLHRLQTKAEQLKWLREKWTNYAYHFGSLDQERSGNRWYLQDCAMHAANTIDVIQVKNIV